MVVDAFVENKFVANNPVALRLVVDAFVEKSEERKAPVAERLVVEAFDINAFVENKLPDISVVEAWVI